MRSANLKYEVDFLLVDAKSRTLSVIEHKTGRQFDVGKSKMIARDLVTNAMPISSGLPYAVKSYACSFSCLTTQEVVAAFKNKVPSTQAMTGPELCKKMGLDYQENINWISRQAKENGEYFVARLMQDELFQQRAIPQVDAAQFMSFSMNQEKMVAWLKSKDGQNFLASNDLADA